MNRTQMTIPLILTNSYNGLSDLRVNTQQ